MTHAAHPDTERGWRAGLPSQASAERAAAIVIASPLLVWPALLNGYPIIFVDTAAYLLHTITGEAPWDKTAAYGPFLWLFHQGFSLWLSVAAQGLILSSVLWLTQRVACGVVSPTRHLLLALGLGGLSSAPWFAATVMPDFFTPIVVLCLFLLGFGEARLSRAEMAGTGILGAVAIAVHLSHLPTALALVMLVLVIRRRWQPTLRAALPVMAAIMFLLGTTWHATGRVTLSANGAVFLFARLQADGPATWTLRDRCPASDWYLCDFIDRMPMDSDHFLWNPRSPPAMDAAGRHRPMGAVLLAPEARAVVAATLRAYPADVAAAALRNTLAQLSRTRVGDMFDEADLDQFGEGVLARGFPARERAAFAQGAQMQGALARLAAPALRLHGAVLVLSAILLVAVAWRPAFRADRQRLGLVLCILLGMAANAFATGALSKPHDRYQARIIWLLPLGAAIAAWPAGLVFRARPKAPALEPMT
ncbi:hypothetical protein [Elioraea sp.]|uniref:hypothetical protein n=1 Tax=Elioraea sp. TaxID=2185103 RepID=UPI0025C0EB2D|nr:hypothetical protein [Elioraea sp.]